MLPSVHTSFLDHLRFVYTQRPQGENARGNLAHANGIVPEKGEYYDSGFQRGKAEPFLDVSMTYGNEPQSNDGGSLRPLQQVGSDGILIYVALLLSCVLDTHRHQLGQPASVTKTLYTVDYDLNVCISEGLHDFECNFCGASAGAVQVRQS